MGGFAIASAPVVCSNPNSVFDSKSVQLLKVPSDSSHQHPCRLGLPPVTVRSTRQMRMPPVGAGDHQRIPGGSDGCAGQVVEGVGGHIRPAI